MKLMQMRRKFWLGAALLASAAMGGGTAAAQFGPAGYVEDAGSALNRYLKELADSPRSLSALLGAAKAALELGDPQAAVTFYARAEQIAPRDGRIKAGIGAAFLAMEQPAPALKFLEEARGLGLPEGVVAADRGLAHDLLGDPVQAQRDYQLAMRVNDGEEVRRRLALSRAISGDRSGALAAIEDQVRRKNPAGWRVRAFVLALTGDASGATDAARSVMPAQAAALQPFFQRLPQLRPAERAMAVHFGRFPGDAAPGAMPAPLPNYAALPPNIVLGGRPDPNQASLAKPRLAETAASALRRRPGEAEERTQIAARIGRPVGISPGPSTPAPAATNGPQTPLPVARTPGPVQGPPDGGARATAGLAAPAPGVTNSASTLAPTPGISAIELPPSAPAASIRSAEGAPVPAPGAAAIAQSAPAGPRLASVAAAIRALDDPGATTPDGPEAAPPAASKLDAPAASPPAPVLPPATTVSPAVTEASPVLLAKRTEIPSPGATTSAPAKPAPSRRLWVQLGGKPDEAGLIAEFQRLKGRAPELLGDKAAWTAPANASGSRLLVGPFKSRDDADLFVGLLDDEGLRASVWTSPAGQEIVKLAGGPGSSQNN